MTPENNELIKRRDILFMPPQQESDPATAALTLLDGVKGIIETSRNNSHSIHVCYNLCLITMSDIEDALHEIGFHLDNSLLSKIKRALYYYTEETQLANLGYEHDQSKSTLEVFINRYNQLPHGCRDERPDYYRRYR